MEEKDIIEMRRQLACLQEKLSNQQIVSDRLLRESMKNKVSVIKHGETASYVAAILSLLLYPVLAYEGIFSVSLCIATCLMLFFCLAATLYIHHPVNRTDLMTADLATVASIMDRFVRQYDAWLHYVAPALLLPWITWTCLDWLKHNINLDINPLLILLPVLVGCVIGGFFGYMSHRKTVNAAKSILRQIEE